MVKYIKIDTVRKLKPTGMYHARIRVMLKATINDPQGITIMRAVDRIGIGGSINSLRAGKCFEVEIDAKTRDDAKVQVTEICDQLLCNPIIETYDFDLNGPS